MADLFYESLFSDLFGDLGNDIDYYGFSDRIEDDADYGCTQTIMRGNRIA